MPGPAIRRPDDDEAKTRCGRRMWLKDPAFFTLHLSSLDDAEHGSGPDRRRPSAVLERHRRDVGALWPPPAQAEPDLMVAVVSDHGFAPIEHDMTLGGLRRRRPHHPRPRTGKPAPGTPAVGLGVSAPSSWRDPTIRRCRPRSRPCWPDWPPIPRLGINRSSMRRDRQRWRRRRRRLLDRLQARLPVRRPDPGRRRFT